jgi:hypothetical protein
VIPERVAGVNEHQVKITLEGEMLESVVEHMDIRLEAFLELAGHGVATGTDSDDDAGEASRKEKGFVARVRDSGEQVSPIGDDPDRGSRPPSISATDNGWTVSFLHEQTGNVLDKGRLPRSSEGEIPHADGEGRRALRPHISRLIQRQAKGYAEFEQEG